MVNNKINNILIPNISKLPSQKNVDLSNKLDGNGQIKESEFKKILDSNLEDRNSATAVEEEGYGIKLSSHAARRLQERNLIIDNDEYFKLKGAIDKLRDKGGKDSLIITNNAAYIVDVDNNKIVTAMDKNNMAENVFTKIDSTLFVN